MVSRLFLVYASSAWSSYSLRENSYLGHMYNPIIEHIDMKTRCTYFYKCKQKMKQMT